jgi:hypothetical protein
VEDREAVNRRSQGDNISQINANSADHRSVAIDDTVEFKRPVSDLAQLPDISFSLGDISFSDILLFS